MPPAWGSVGIGGRFSGGLGFSGWPTWASSRHHPCQAVAVTTCPAVPADQRQLNVPLPTPLVEAVKARAAEEGITMGELVEQLLTAAMQGWEPAPGIRERLADHEARLQRIESRLGQ